MVADLKSATGFIWFSIAGQSKKKRKKKKQSDGALCFNACLLSCIFYTHGLNLREKPKVLYLSFARIKISFNCDLLSLSFNNNSRLVLELTLFGQGLKDTWSFVIGHAL